MTCHIKQWIWLLFLVIILVNLLVTGAPGLSVICYIPRSWVTPPNICFFYVEYIKRDRITAVVENIHILLSTGTNNSPGILWEMFDFCEVCIYLLIKWVENYACVVMMISISIKSSVLEVPLWIIKWTHHQTSNIRHSLIGNTIVDNSDVVGAAPMLEYRLSALLQLHLHSQLNTRLQYIAQRQLQDETRHI